MKYIGKDMSRVDGIAKVTGKARYAAEYQLENTAYGYIVQSEIPKGTITKLDTAEADKASGVLKIISHLNCPKVEEKSNEFRAFQSAEIKFEGQPIALVVANTFEQARYAANLVSATFSKAEAATDFDKAMSDPERLIERGKANPRGNPDKAFADSYAKVEAEYTIPIEHHNAMEPHGATAFWKDGKLTIFDKSQGVFGVQNHLAVSFGIPKENVNVVSLFVGGAFGSALMPNYYPYITALAAREVKRPVKVNYTRRQMFTGHGYRPYTFQKVKIGADKTGKLQSVIHQSYSNTASFKNFGEDSAPFGRTLYACPNYDSPYSLVKTDLPSPIWMRAPGAVSGAFALESAIDELAYKLKIDPLEFRKINYAETDPESGKPFSSKALMDCFEAGSKKFGWDKRKLEPRSMKDKDGLLVGWGTAIGTWGAWQAPASARVTIKADGTVNVGSGTTDIGPGTYTVITMIAAEFLGVEPDKVNFDLGDSNLPQAPSQGGSVTTASVGSAVYGAAMNLKKKLRDLAIEGSGTGILGTASADELELADGALRLKAEPSKSIAVDAILKLNGLKELVDEYTATPNPERGKYTTMAHGAQFVEVKVDEALGNIRVTRVVEATACGRVMNPKTSHSQEMGGIVWGIGMALQEDTQIDHRYGKMMTTNFADYHIPTNADVFSIETDFVDEKDEIVNELGIKGMGELCLVGIPAAIANAVFHATGKRVRDLPITLDKVIA